MRYIIPMLFVSATAFVGCHSPSPVHTQTAAQIRATPPSFRPLLITTHGTHTSSDGAWRIAVSEGSLDLARSFAYGDGQGFASTGWSTVSPQGWKAQSGWFVFIESESRVWAYDGVRKLLLQTKTSSLNHSTGTTYSTRYPCAVPAEVSARLSEPARRSIQTHE